MITSIFSFCHNVLKRFFSWVDKCVYGAVEGKPNVQVTEYVNSVWFPELSTFPKIVFQLPQKQQDF